jgi:hypothetical protein
MAAQPDWSKRSVIATWVIGVVTVVLWTVGYLFPSDPAHQPRLDFLSHTILIPVPLWIAVSPVIALLAVMSYTIRHLRGLATRYAQDVALAKAEVTQLQNELATSKAGVTMVVSSAPTLPEKVFHANPTSLDPRVNKREAKIGYTAKLRLSLTSDSGQMITVRPLQWLTKEGNISVQCGVSPFPGIPFEPGNAPFMYRYQLEESLGSWKFDKWKRTPSGQHDEQNELNVLPGWTFRVWIGLNPCVPHNTLENLRKNRQLGTVIFPIVIGGNEFEWKLEV